MTAIGSLVSVWQLDLCTHAALTECPTLGTLALCVHAIWSCCPTLIYCACEHDQLLHVAGDIEGSTDEHGRPMRGLLIDMKKARLPESQRQWKSLFAGQSGRVADFNMSEE